METLKSIEIKEKISAVLCDYVIDFQQGWDHKFYVSVIEDCENSNHKVFKFVFGYNMVKVTSYDERVILNMLDDGVWQDELLQFVRGIMK